LYHAQAVARNGNRIESRNFMYKEMSHLLGKVVFRCMLLGGASMAAWVCSLFINVS